MVMKKNTDNLTKDNIFKVFSKGNSRSGVVAQFIYENTQYDPNKEKNDFFKRF
jgi:hypothetical protein